MRVELVDAAPDDDPRDVTTKRFPTWGDTADLVALLDVVPDGDGTYVGAAIRADERRPVVEGSQMLGQAVVAARRHTGGRRVVSAQMVFLRAADSRLPLRFELDERMRRAGRSPRSRSTSARAIGCARRARSCSTRPLRI